MCEFHTPTEKEHSTQSSNALTLDIYRLCVTMCPPHGEGTRHNGNNPSQNAQGDAYQLQPYRHGDMLSQMGVTPERRSQKKKSAKGKSQPETQLLIKLISGLASVSV